MTALAVLSILSMHVTAADAGRGKRVKLAASTRVFVMASFASDCTFKGFPEMQITVAPTKGQVSFKTGDPATIQYSLSGKCVGTSVHGTGIYYTRPRPTKAETIALR